MQISELITLLQQKLGEHGDREVKITWEGVKRGIGLPDVWLAKDGALYIDADGNFYKDEDAVNPKEGEQ